jgi:EAL domain-containing protein (putative c-di-GMP-specific phosphodiesterase class I)
MPQDSQKRRPDDFDHIVDSRLVGAAFQPITELTTGDIVGFEALARPPNPSTFPDVASLFEEAYRRGRVGELDWVCRAAVFRAVLDHHVPPELPIFVNVEPAALNAPCPADIIGPFAAATHQGRFVVEVTERAHADDPAELLAAVDRTRDVAIGVALDDVGARPASLALMPLIAPDVIKLDLSLVQNQPTPEIARIVSVIRSEAERTGAVIVAEGIESAHHVTVAESMGATLGQGWLFGMPGELPADLTTPRHALTPFSAPSHTADTPFDEARRRRTPRASNRRLLAAASEHLEHEFLASTGKAVLLASFQHQRNLTPTIRRRYERLAQHTVLTAALGQDMPSAPGPGIRGVDLDPEDPLCREWTVVVLGHQLAGALIARQTTDASDEFDAIITHDRDLVIAAARSLCRRLPPVPVTV